MPRATVAANVKLISTQGKSIVDAFGFFSDRNLGVQVEATTLVLVSESERISSPIKGFSTTLAEFND